MIEIAKQLLVGTLVAFLALGPGARVLAEPVLQEVVSGEVTVKDLGELHGIDRTEIDVTHGSVANYSDFDIGADEAVNVNFLTGDGGSHLARVISFGATNIDGSLVSNGHVYLVNPAGVYFNEGSTFNATSLEAGIHAAAGRISEVDFALLQPGNEGEVRYLDLQGTVKNLGTITAPIVDLVARNVVQAGTIRSRAGEDGFFVLVVGEDVTIGRLSDDNGRLQISVTIPGLATDVLNEMNAVAVDFEATDATGNPLISDMTAADGEIYIGLGAGDLVGSAINYMGNAEARKVTLSARGGDTKVLGTEDANGNPVAASITANQIDLCAGPGCQGFHFQPDPDDPDAPRDAVFVSSAAVFEGDDVTPPPDEDGEPLLDENGDPIVIKPLLSIIQDASAEIHDDPAKTSGIHSHPLTASDHQIFIRSSDSIDVLASIDPLTPHVIDAPAIVLHAGADGTDDLNVGDSVSLQSRVVQLRAGDGADIASEAPGQVLVADTAEFAGRLDPDEPTAPPELEIFTIRQDASIALENVVEADQVHDATVYGLRSDEGGAVIDSDIAARLTAADGHNQDWELVVVTQDDLVVEADLTARSLALHAGAATGTAFPPSGDLIVGSEEGPPVTLYADEVELHAGDFGDSIISGETSEVQLLGNPQFRDTERNRAPHVVVVHQDASIGFDDDTGENESILGTAPTDASFGAIGADDEIDYTLQSDAGLLQLEEEDIQALEQTLPHAHIHLKNGINAWSSSVGVLADLEARSIEINTPGDTISTSAAGDLRATHGDVDIVGSLGLRGDDTQTIQADQGYVRLLESELGAIPLLRKSGGGDLVLEAGAADGKPLDLDGNIDVVDGNLELTDYDLAGDVNVIGRMDEDGNEVGGVLILRGDGNLDGKARFLGEAPLQTLQAERLVVAGSVEKTTGGVLILIGKKSLDVVGSVGIENTTEEDISEALDQAALVLRSNESVTVDGIGGRLAHLKAQDLVLDASTGGTGPDGAEVNLGKVLIWRDGDLDDPDRTPAPLESFGLVQDADVDGTEGLSLDNFEDGLAPRTYIVESANGSMEIGLDLAHDLVGDTGGIDSDLLLRSGGGMNVKAALGAKTLILHANTDPDLDEDLGVTAPLSADEITLHAGSEGQTDGFVLLAGTNAKLLGRDGTSSPNAVTIRQDVSFDGPGSVPDQSVFGNVTGRMHYTLDSDGGEILVSDAAGTAAGLRNDSFVVELEARDDVTIASDMNAHTVITHAGTEGFGNTLVGVSWDESTNAFVEDPDQPEIRADAVFGAGDGTTDGSAEVRIGEDVVFAPPDPARYVFAIEQDAAITDDHLPELSQFGADAGNIHYRLQSNGSNVVVNTADKVAGTHLSLLGNRNVNGMVLDVEPAGTNALVLASLNMGSSGVVTSQAVLGQSVAATDGDIVIDAPLVFHGARDPASGEPPVEDRGLFATGDISVEELQYTDLVGFGPGSNLDIQAGGGITVGSVLFASAGEEAIAEPPAVLNVYAEHGDVTLGNVTTRAPVGEPVPNIVITAEEGQLTLEGQVASGDQIGEAHGSIDLKGGQGIWIGSANPAIPEPDPGLVEQPVVHETVKLMGSDVTIVSAVGRTEVTAEDEEGAVIDTDEISRDLVVEATGAVSFADPSVPGLLSVDVSALNVQGQSVDMQADLTVESLVIDADDDVIVAGNVRAGELELISDSGDVSIHAGSDLELKGERIEGQSIDLAAGAGVHGLDLGDTRFMNLEGEAPDALTVQQAEAMTAADVSALIDQIGATPDTEIDGMRLGLLSTGGAVAIDADDVNTMHLRAGGVEDEGVTIAGDLDVDSLILDSSARVEGDLVVRFEDLRAASDLHVEGDVEVTSRARFVGDSDQTFSAGGAITAPLVTKSGGSSKLVMTSGTTVEDSSISLLGSVTGDTLLSADGGGGSLVFQSDVILGGDVVADDLIEFKAADQSGIGITLNGVQDQRVLGREVRITTTDELTKTVGRTLADQSLELGGASLFSVNQNIRAGHDLTLVGLGTLSGGPERSLTAETGTLAFRREDVATQAGVPDAGVQGANLTLAAAETIVINGTGEPDEEFLIAGLQLRIPGEFQVDGAPVENASVSGAGNLTIDASVGGDSGLIDLGTDVLLEDSSTLTLISEAANGIMFNAPATTTVVIDGVEELVPVTQVAQAGEIAINPQGHASGSLATVGRREDGNLALIASAGDVKMGAGEILTVVGDLDVSASDLAVLGQVNALSIDVQAGGVVANTDAGPVDFNANRVFLSTRPVGSGGHTVTIATPTTAEISDNLVSDSTLVRTLRPNLAPLSAADLVDANGALVDFSPTGSARDEPARQLATPVLPVRELSKQALAELVAVAATVRPLLADELVGYLQVASLGGEVSASAIPRDPRLEGERVELVLQSYRGLFAPTARFDPDTGGRIVRSHAPRMRDAFAAAVEACGLAGQPQPGRAFADCLDTQRLHGEASFYVANLRDLMREAVEAGLDPDQIDRMSLLLVADLTPEGVSPEVLAEAIRP